MAYTPLQMADAFIQAGELPDALDALNQHLQDHPDDAAALRLRISVQLRMGDEESLLAALVDTESLAQKSAEDYQQISVIQQRLGNLGAAEDAMRAALGLAPGDVRMSERLVDLLQQEGELQGALEIVREQERSWKWLQWEGDLLAQLGDHTMATARYGLALAQLSEYEGQMRMDYLQALQARLLLARADSYRHLGQYDVSRQHYEEAQKLLPEDPAIAFNLGILAALSGELAAGVAQCRTALQSAPDAMRQEMLTSVQKDPSLAELAQSLEA
ncbi:MAG: tetratricopeptide repeat protein [Anaerolineae bacterium]|nr:tetratricopeptide repeat protein [Anaerolineae bacterium]